MNIVPNDSKYIPLTQQKWCCVPTCIQMVMLKHNIALVPAELIGYKMGLVIPEDQKEYFWNARSGKRPPAGYGTQAGETKYSPNIVFKDLNIPLKMSWTLIDKFDSIDLFKNYLSKIVETQKDILICYDWGSLFDRNYQGGHVCVLDKVFVNDNTIRIIDPDYNSPKWRIVEIDKMYQAMKVHGKDNSAGFWELEYIS